MSDAARKTEEPLTPNPSPLLTGARGTIALLFTLIVASLARGDSVTLPLDGYFHPGRYMPVKIIADPPEGQPANLWVRGVETVSAAIASRGGERLDATVPVMPMTADPQSLWWAWGGQHAQEIRPALRPLTEKQRLVGYGEGSVTAGDASKVSASIYPGTTAIPQRLNPALPLPGAAACWEALDLVALDGPAMTRVGEERLSALVAAGVAFAVHAEKPPWPHWPWKPAADGWWVLHHDTAGPVAATFNPGAYSPVSGLVGGWPASMRWKYALEGVAFVLIMLLLALWRPRHAGLIAMGISVLTAGALVYWHQWERPLRVVEGKIRVIGPGITQDDDWAYFTAPQRTFSRNRWVNTMKLVLPAPGMLADMDPRVECFSNGDPSVLAFSVLPNTKAALLCRRCGPQAPVIAPQAGEPPASIRLVKEQYLRTGDEVVGQLPTSPLITEGYYGFEQWPAVVVRRAK